MMNNVFAAPTASWNQYGVNTTYSSQGNYDIMNTSFSGSDMIAQMMFPGSIPITVGTASTLTYSVYREKRQVRTLGRMSAKGVTKGGLTVAGTIIFTVINQHIINDIKNAIYRQNPNSPIAQVRRLRMDELPPFDLIITFANEYGQSAKMVIYGVTVTDEAMTFSIEDLFTENTMTYMARDIDTMRGPWSPDMNMYNQIGADYGNNKLLPKYGYDPQKLWPAMQAQYQAQMGNLLQKALDAYDKLRPSVPIAPVAQPLTSAIQADTSPIHGGLHDHTVAQTNIGQIHVTVLDASGKAIKGVELLATWSGHKEQMQTTNSSGQALFDKLPLEGGEARVTIHVNSSDWAETNNPTPVKVSADYTPVVTMYVHSTSNSDLGGVIAGGIASAAGSAALITALVNWLKSHLPDSILKWFGSSASATAEEIGTALEASPKVTAALDEMVSIGKATSEVMGAFEAAVGEEVPVLLGEAGVPELLIPEATDLLVPIIVDGVEATAVLIL